jgi:hypothetical protein
MTEQEQEKLRMLRANLDATTNLTKAVIGQASYDPKPVMFESLPRPEIEPATQQAFFGAILWVMQQPTPAEKIQQFGGGTKGTIKFLIWAGISIGAWVFLFTHIDFIAKCYGW